MLLLTTIAAFPLAAHAQSAPMDGAGDMGAGDLGAGDSGGDGRVIVVTGRADGYRPLDTGAIKTPTPLLDVPQAITVLTRAQLDDQAVTQLGEALRYVPGVVLGQGEGHRDQITLRGQNTTADFYLDGQRDDTQYYRSLYNIERVEVLKGANALLFGRGGGGGVINRVSKAPDVARRLGSLSAGVDSFGAFALAADLNQPLKEALGARLNGTYEELRNHRQAFNGRFIGVNPEIAFEPSKATRIALSYTYDDDRRITDRGVPSLGGVPAEGYTSTFFGRSDVNTSRVKVHIVQARLDQELAKNLTLSVSGQFNHTDKYYDNVFPNAAINAAAQTVLFSGYNSFAIRTSWTGQANLVWQGQTGGIGHTVLAGIEAGDQRTDSSRSEAIFSGSPVISLARPLAQPLAIPAVRFGAPSRAALADVRTFSAYVQDQIELAPFLQIVGGVRYDAFRIRAVNQLNASTAARTDRKWSPRAGVIVKPRANVSIYGSYTRSFLPQSGDQFSALDAVQATLAPEAFVNLEAGAKWDVTPSLAFTAAAYRLDRDNSRFNNPASGLPELSGKTRTRGIELQLAGRILPQWQASLGYTLQEGVVRSATAAAPVGRKLAQLPHSQIAVWTRYDLTKQLGVALGITHQSSSFATISNAVVLPAFTRVDAGVFYAVTPAIAVQLNVENLFDRRYFPSAHTDNNISTGEPLNARLTVKVKF